MRAAEKRSFVKSLPSVVLLLALLTLLGTAPTSVALQSASKPPELGKVKSIAESQHEIVMLLLEKKDFKAALAEAGKIFEMSWPEDQEATLLKELLYLSDRFMHKDQTSLGLQLLQTNQRMFKKVSSQAAIWKEKGYLFKRMNQTDKALECFREAQRLEKSSPR